MSDMKHYMEHNTLFGKIALVAVTAVSLLGAVMMSGLVIQSGMLAGMALLPALPPALMAALCIWMLRRSVREFPQWWDGLTDVQRAEYMQDFANARNEDDFLRLGERYAYIRHIGRPIAYGEIGDIYFHRSRSGNGMHVILRDGTHMVTIAPTFANRTAIVDTLMQHNRKFW